jgi:hypothetical protein
MASSGTALFLELVFVFVGNSEAKSGLWPFVLGSFVGGYHFSEERSVSIL